MQRARTHARRRTHTRAREREKLHFEIRYFDPHPFFFAVPNILLTIVSKLSLYTANSHTFASQCTGVSTRINVSVVFVMWLWYIMAIHQPF